MTIDTVVASNDIDTAYVELYILDLSSMGGSVYRFTNSYPAAGDTTVGFGGNAYATLPIISSGFEVKNDGSQPRPSLQLSNVDATLLSVVIATGDMVGAKITRLRTFAKFLDSGSSPDSTQTLPPDIYFIEQKLQQNSTTITWQLCSALEKNSVRLPRRQITRAGDARYCAFPAAGATRIRG